MKLIDQLLLDKKTKNLIRFNEIIEDINEVMEGKHLEKLSKRLDKISGYDDEVKLFQSIIKSLCRK